jgi:hypothetical protein
MYSTASVTPLAMGIGSGSILPLLGMQPLWAVLAAFALFACASAVKRVIPRLIVEGQDWKRPGADSKMAGTRPSAWLAR